MGSGKLPSAEVHRFKASFDSCFLEMRELHRSQMVRLAFYEKLRCACAVHINQVITIPVIKKTLSKFSPSNCVAVLGDAEDQYTFASINHKHDIAE